MLDNGRLLVWNLEFLAELKSNTPVDLFGAHKGNTIECRLPSVAYNSHRNNHVAFSLGTNPSNGRASNLLMHNLRNNACATRILDDSTQSQSLGGLLDGAAAVSLLAVDSGCRYCFIVGEIDEFAGKQLPSETDFVKKICCLLDVSDVRRRRHHRMLETFSYIVRKGSRFEIQVRIQEFFESRSQSVLNYF